MQRYVAEREEWKTRGFYLEVTMDHRKVPDLLVALANAGWPVRVMRVHQADSKPEDLVPFNELTPLASGSRGGGNSAYVAAMNAQMARMGRSGDMGMGRGPMMGRSGRGPITVNPLSEQALNDHMLASVALDGVITVFKKPPEEPAPPETTAPSTTTPAAAETAAPASPASPAEGQPASDAEEQKKDGADAAPSEKPESR